MRRTPERKPSGELSARLPGRAQARRDRLRPARPSDFAAIAALVRRSKAHWGYSPEFMAHFWAGLAIRQAHLALGRYVVMLREGRIVGIAGRRGRLLEDLFIAPEAIGGGVGRALLRWALDDARRDGLPLILVDSDPYALGFYRRLGGWPVGVTPSPWPGDPARRLPRLRLLTAARRR